MKSSYVELLKDPRWQRKRLEVFNRDGFACKFCGDSRSNLQVHHKRYERGKKPWEVASHHLVTLCERCHERVTQLLAEAKNALAEMPPDQLLYAVNQLTGGAVHPLQAALDHCQREKDRITETTYTTNASRRVEALDELADGIWSLLAVGATAS